MRWRGRGWPGRKRPRPRTVRLAKIAGGNRRAIPGPKKLDPANSDNQTPGRESSDRRTPGHEMPGLASPDLKRRSLKIPEDMMTGANRVKDHPRGRDRREDRRRD